MSARTPSPDMAVTPVPGAEALAWRVYARAPMARHGLGAAVVGETLDTMLGGERPGPSMSGAVESLG